MSFRIFIHQNCVETIEQLCLAAKETFPDDPTIQSEAFQLLCPKDAYKDQYRSMYIHPFPPLYPPRPLIMPLQHMLSIPLITISSRCPLLSPSPPLPSLVASSMLHCGYV